MLKHFFSWLATPFNEEEDEQARPSSSDLQSEVYHKPTSIKEAYSNVRYRGKIVIESPAGLFSTTQEDRAIKKLRQLRKKYDSDEVTTTIIPDGMLVPTPTKVSKS